MMLFIIQPWFPTEIRPLTGHQTRKQKAGKRKYSITKYLHKIKYIHQGLGGWIVKDIYNLLYSRNQKGISYIIGSGCGYIKFAMMLYKGI